MKLFYKLTFVLFLVFIFFGCQQEISEQIRQPDQLVISGFTPDSAKVGDVIMIYGTGFNIAIDENIVVINNNLQQVLLATDSTLTIKISTATTSGKIKVQANSQEALSSGVLVISSAPQSPQLKIISFTPGRVQVGDTVTIKGTGFGSILSGNVVSINNIPSELISANDSVMKIEVLGGTTTGKISATVNGVTAVSLTNLEIITGDFWTRKADPPLIGDIFVKGFSSSTKGYLLKSAKLAEYDPTNNSWVFKSGVPATIKNYGFSFTIASKAYIGLGSSGSGNPTFMSKEVWEYDMTNNTWTRKNDFPGPPRIASFSFSINNFGYVGGGDTTNANLRSTKDVWKYNPQSDSWTRLSDYPGTRTNGVTGFAIADVGFVLEIGQNNPTAFATSVPSVSLWSYNPASDTWTQKTTLTTGNGINSAVVFNINGRAFAVIGSGMPGELQPVKNDFWEYIPATNSWTKRADAGEPIRWFGTGFSIGSKGYVGLGTGDRSNIDRFDFWEYTPD